MTTHKAELLVIPSEVPTFFEVGTESSNLMLSRARRSLDKPARNAAHSVAGGLGMTENANYGRVYANKPTGFRW